jgi:hypothetical protein
MKMQSGQATFQKFVATMNSMYPDDDLELSTSETLPNTYIIQHRVTDRYVGLCVTPESVKLTYRDVNNEPVAVTIQDVGLMAFFLGSYFTGHSLTVPPV